MISPIEAYETEQTQHREATADHVRKLWLSFVARQYILIMFAIVGGGILAPFIGAMTIVIAAGIWILSWISALKLGYFVTQNQEWLRWPVAMRAFVPALIVATEAVAILYVMPPLDQLW